MKRFEGVAGSRKWLAALLVAAVSTGCGGGGGGDDNPSPGPVAGVAPTVSGTANVNGAINVPVNTKVGATFSEPMDPASITPANFFVMQGTTAVPGSVSYSGVSALLVPLATLAPFTRYTVTLKGGVGGVRGLAGTPLAGDFSWSWTTGMAADTRAPTVSSTINGNGATGIALNTKVGATFSEAMDVTTINGSTFFLMQGTTPVAATVSYSGVSAVLTPSSNLAPGTTYTVTAKGGPGGVADLAGNVLVRDYSWYWTTSATADTTAPTVSATINADGATNVPVNTRVGATFSEAMDPLSVTIRTFFLAQGSTAVAGTVGYSGVTALFIPSGNLLPNTVYTVTVKGGADGVKDLAGNVMASDRVLSWATGSAADSGSPAVISTSIANGATNVATNAPVNATFSESMDPMSITNVSCTLVQTSGGTPADRWTVTYSGTRVEFHPDTYDFGPLPPSVLLANTTYRVTIVGGADGVLDLAGNPMAGDYTWTFTTGAGPQ